jgi:hypothetical protein
MSISQVPVKKEYVTPKLVNYGNLAEIVKKSKAVSEVNGNPGSKP